MTPNYAERIIEYTSEYAQRGCPRKYHVITLGCQQNEADSEKLRGGLESLGYIKAESEDEANVILVNTCAVREHAEMRALSFIGRLKHRKTAASDTVIGICGCMTARAERIEQLKKSYPYVDFTLSPGGIHLLSEALHRALFSERRRSFHRPDDRDGDISVGETALEEMPQVRSDSRRAWVSVMRGCNNFCSYCIVPHTRGRERSRPRENVLAEVRALADRGYREITLLGQNVNSYQAEGGFAELVRDISKIEGDFWLRFMTSHPKDVSDELIEVISSSDKIETHFHLPLQSGSDRVLAQMNRKYNREHYLAIVDKLRKAVPNIAITTDMIVGFPGETEEDFEATLDVVRRVGFDMIYSFIYSKRSGTPAAEYEQQIDRETQNARFKRLLSTQDEISLEKNMAYVDHTCRVLFESERDGVLTGRTQSGKLVHAPGEISLVGEFAQCMIKRAEPYALLGEIIK